MTAHDPDRYPHNGGNADLDLLCQACINGDKEDE